MLHERLDHSELVALLVLLMSFLWNDIRNELRPEGKFRAAR